jgi:PadR family transcriptional regulator PadR
MHGWGISLRLQQLSRDVLQINQGTLYPALHRMERAGWITSDSRPSENNRRAKYYELTKPGRQQLVAERESWALFARAVAEVMGTS